MIELFDFQKTLVDDFHRALDKGFRRPLIVCPTGGGKTVVASHLIKEWLSNSKRVLFVAHRDELLLQAKDKLKKFGIDAGLIKSGRDKDARPQALCQIASIQTLYSRCLRDGSTQEPPPAELVFIDETHRVRSMTYMRLVEEYCRQHHLGINSNALSL